ncbi:MAG: GNAT family N-acetyltransferase [Clostridia bacterium]|nr:GNAT family N-acetyltransferase [Clostridia bacterium]MBQ8512577.1 GNAT family N-acetyltransferase [Clostridia bacterium]
MNELFELYRRCFPFCVREESVVHELLDGGNVIGEYADGHLIGAAVTEKNNILLLCVDCAYRNRGIGSRLLAAAEHSVRDAGYTELTVGAGEHYIMPGIPAVHPVVEESLRPDAVYAGLEDHTAFFQKRGYTHRWDCNCFDMRAEFDSLPPVPTRDDGIAFRFASVQDLPAVCECVQSAHEPFVKYYRDPAIYGTENRRVLIAEHGSTVTGALMVCTETEGRGLGSVGCTAVHEDWQGRKIAADLVIRGTHALRDSGMERAYLGYTYTGLDILYGAAGYRICCYYMMGGKKLLSTSSASAASV